MKGRHEKIIPLKDELPSEVLPRHVDYSKDNNQLVYSLSRMEFDISFGSRESIEFLDGLLDSPHVEIFNSLAIQNYIRYMWKGAKIWFLFESIGFTLYLLFLSMHAVFTRGSSWNVVVILSFSLTQACEQIWQRAGQKRKYFCKLVNIVHMTGVVSVWTYGAFHFLGAYEEIRIVLLTYSTALIWWKTFSFTRFKQANRFFIRTVGVTFLNIRAFLSFMLLYVIAFAVIFFAA